MDIKNLFFSKMRKKENYKSIILFNSDIKPIKIIKRKRKFKKISKNNCKKCLFFLSLLLLFFFIFIIINQKLGYFSQQALRVNNYKNNQLLSINNANNKTEFNIIISNINLTNNLLKRVNDTYGKNEYVNINEIESTIPGGRPWIKGQNKIKEINVGIGIDSKYVLQAMMTISSVMDSQKNETKLRIHIGVVDGFPVEKMIKMYILRERIRNDVEFNFYNAKRVETELKGVHTKGNAVMAKLVLAVLLPNDVERVIILDTGDLLVLRDLSEMYNWNMNNKTICGVLDPGVMKYGRISKKVIDIYINAGNFLIDVKKFKNDRIYEKTVENKNIYPPTFVALQSYLNDVAYGKIGYIPMRFGIFGPFPNDRRSDTPPYITSYDFLHKAKYHEIYPFLPKNRSEMNVQAYNPVIIHQWNGKWADGSGLTIYRRIAQFYIKYAGIWDETCEKYPGYCEK